MDQYFYSSSDSESITEPQNKRLKIADVSLATTLGDEELIHLPSCLMNASGARCTTHSELEKLMNCPHTGAVVSKSCTRNYRVGNPLPRYYQDHTSYSGQPAFSINSTGLANLGIEEYLKVYDIKTPKTKPYFISIAGLSLEENLDMIRYMRDNSETNRENLPDIIELNLSCPNVIGKPQIGYDFDASEDLLRKVFELAPEARLGVKLPPYFDFVHHDQMAEVLKMFPIYHVTCINSLGNGLVIDWASESAVIKPKHGFGGIGGSVVKPIALANVRRFSQLLPGVSVIGCGGVRTGWDAFEHILAGASVVQIGTQLMIEGRDCFQRIEKELKLVMQTKGYETLDDFQGCLRDYSDEGIRTYRSVNRSEVVVAMQ